MINHSLLEKKDLLKVMFQKFDRRGRGYISQNDLVAVGRTMAEKDECALCVHTYGCVSIICTSLMSYVVCVHVCMQASMHLLQV